MKGHNDHKNRASYLTKTFFRNKWGKTEPADLGSTGKRTLNGKKDTWDYNSVC